MKAHFQSPKDLHRWSNYFWNLKSAYNDNRTKNRGSGRMVEFHLTLVKSGDCLEKVEGSNVPHLRAADDLQAVWMKDTV